MCEYRARRYFLRARNQCVIYLGNTTIARGECKVMTGGLRAKFFGQKCQIQMMMKQMKMKRKRKTPLLLLLFPRLDATSLHTMVGHTVGYSHSSTISDRLTIQNI